MVRTRRALAIGGLLVACSRPTPPPSADAGPGANASAAAASAILPLREPERSSSALALLVAGTARVAVIADEDDKRLRFVALADGKELASVVLGGTPGHVVVDASGAAWVALRDADRVERHVLVCPKKALAACDVTSGPRFETAREPIALAVTERALHVASGWGRSLETLDPKTGKRLSSIALAREPRALLVSESGERATIAHAAGSTLTTVALVTGSSEEQRLDWRDVGMFDHSTVRGDEPRFAGQGFALARAGAMERERVLGPAALTYPGEAQEASGYGGTDTAYFPGEPCIASVDATGATKLRTRGSVVDAAARRSSHGRVPWPKATPACLLPRAAATNPIDGKLLVACLGIDQIAAIDPDEKPLVESMGGRWSVPSGPVALAIDVEKREGWVWSMFDRKLSRIALDRPGAPTTSFDVPRTKERDAAWLTGQRLFHAPVAFDGRACASCHPDGRTDGISWSSPLGPLQTPMLAGRVHDTAPFGWKGDATSIEAHLEQTMKRLEARSVSKDELRALVAYVSAAPTYLSTPALAPLEERGRVVFESTQAGCSTCHHDGGRTGDGVPHDVGTGGSFDTPSLRFVAGTAPYLHDGRYGTLRELLVRTDGKMGSTKHLREPDVLALIAYLRAI